jgi:hypothetical protein
VGSMCSDDDLQPRSYRLNLASFAAKEHWQLSHFEPGNH